MLFSIYGLLSAIIKKSDIIKTIFSIFIKKLDF